MLKKHFLFLFLGLFVNLYSSSTELKPAKQQVNNRAIIFDMDGTLVDSLDAKVLAWQEAFKAYGIKTTYEEISSLAGGIGSHIKAFMEKKHNVSISDEVTTRMHQIYDSCQREKVKPIDAAISLVKHLHANKTKYNILLAVASAARKKEIIKSLKIAGIENCFDAIVSGRDDLQEYKLPNGTNKPQPCIYLEAARLLGIPSWMSIAFEDSRTGTEAALQAGMHVFVIPTDITKSQFTDSHYNHRITFLKSATEFDINRYLASQTKMTLQKSLEHKGLFDETLS